MLSWLDLVALGVIIIVVARAQKEGLVKTLLDVFAIFIGVFAASYVCDSLTTAKIIKEADLLSFGIVFIISWLISFVMIEIFLSVIQKIIKITILGGLDGIGGMIVGLFKSILLVAIMMRLVSLLPLSEPWKDWVDQSIARRWSLPVLEQSYTWFFHQLPKNQTLFDKLPKIPEQLPGTSGKDADLKSPTAEEVINVVTKEASEVPSVIKETSRKWLPSVKSK